MSYNIEIFTETATAAQQEHVAAAARSVLELEAAPAGTISIALTDEESLRIANRQFAGIDQATDVLSFVHGDPIPGEDGIYFGDILIALPIAERQASASGHSLSDELSLLTVHGVLHLLGYDHAELNDKDRMWDRQAAALRRLDVDPAIVKEPE